MKESIILIILAVVAVLAIAAMVVVILWNARERRRITKEYEDAEDVLQERITTLTSEKAAFESLLSARDEYETKLQEEREKADKARSERHEKELENMKDVFKALSAENSAAFKSQSAETHPGKVRGV